MRLRMRIRKLKSDWGVSAYRWGLDCLRYAGEVNIMEIEETEDELIIEFKCFSKVAGIQEFVIPRIQSRGHTKVEILK